MPQITIIKAQVIWPRVQEPEQSWQAIDGEPTKVSNLLRVYESEDGRLWAEHSDGLMQQINFCPFTGIMAKVLVKGCAIGKDGLVNCKL